MFPERKLFQEQKLIPEKKLLPEQKMFPEGKLFPKHHPGKLPRGRGKERLSSQVCSGVTRAEPRTR